MDLQELIKVREELKETFERERAKYDSSIDMYKALKDIRSEIGKVNALIDIYGSDDQDYRVMSLETLYLMNISGLSQEEFDERDEETYFDMFDQYFPDEWVVAYDETRKEKVLVEAITANKTIKAIALQKLRREVPE